MKLVVIITTLIIIISCFFSVSTSPTSSSSEKRTRAQDVDVQGIMHAVSSPVSCIGRCVFGLLPNLEAFLSLKGLFDKIVPLCRFAMF
jgi:ABC-type multidrug transport system permease subunit